MLNTRSDLIFNIVCNMEKYDCIGVYLCGVAIVYKHGKYGFIDKAGNEICELKYDWIDSFHKDFSIVKLNNKYGYINTEGKEICEIIYDHCWKRTRNSDIFIVSLNGKEDYMDTDGNLKTNFKYSEIYYFGNWFGGEFARVKLNNKYGVINRDFVEIIKCECNSNTEIEIKLEKYKFKQNRIQKLKNII